MFDHEFCWTSGPWLSPSDYYVECFWRQNICPAVIFLRQMVTLLLFFFFVNRFSELQKKSLMSDWRTHLPSFLLCLQKGPHRMITFYVQCYYIPVFSWNRSCSGEGYMWFLLPELLLLLRVLSLLMSCMVTHLLNRIDLHFTSLEHT